MDSNNDVYKKVVTFDMDVDTDNSITFDIEMYAQKIKNFTDRHILLDTCAGESIFKNKKLIFEIVHALRMVALAHTRPGVGDDVP